MTAKRIDGKIIAEALRARVAKEVAELAAAHGVVPGLTVVLVGDDPASQVYVRNKGKHTADAGMRSDTIRLPAETDQQTLLATIGRLNADPGVHGILVQLPLPAQLDSLAVIQAIDPDKDVDGLHPVNAGRLAQGLPGFVPCTPLGCMIMLEGEIADFSGLEAVVVGRSNLVGKPIAQLLLAKNCTVTMAHSRTRDLPAVCRRADILVAAVGKAELVRGDWIKPGAVVIDVGINRFPLPDGKSRLIGDVAYAEGVEVARAITPVPGGVGLMTVACLLANTLTAARRRLGLSG
ncbi:bifunctional methylenetetrahydrofolate dehydrogenase/methenyltetrahydrofolate cyclohydrolase FolD [Desertibaculum subflavum]|uniref:bifunctional methylenetetrahydrofolate dehydrogenase/methenyltetrahydrofolate cyclohydrolase FolD n=1 Tax=Desertibaculum subflavum TaxID=2268458 RepID=UPI000E66A552